MTLAQSLREKHNSNSELINNTSQETFSLLSQEKPLLVQPDVEVSSAVKNNKPMTDTSYPARKRSARIAKQSQCSNTEGNNVVASENESDVVADVVASENESTTNNACSQGGVSQEKEISTDWQNMKWVQQLQNTLLHGKNLIQVKLHNMIH